jgi:aryl-alcohol dehydrogenase-like predicted oxidoreductase
MEYSKLGKTGVRISRLCLGTAQLGMNYGINNVTGKPSFEESESIIKNAVENGINMFDTAPEYGDSEKIVGACLKDFDKGKLIFISKVPPIDWDKNEEIIVDGVKKNVKKTLENLGIKTLPIYLFHRFEDAIKGNGLILKELKKLKEDGFIGKIGISTYTPDEAEKSLNIGNVEAIQIPFNLVDKRLLENGFLKKAKRKEIVILARSVFLQGLFFKDNIPDKLKEFWPYRRRILTMCEKNNITIGELALRYNLSINELDSILIGVEKTEQLIENLKILKKGKLAKEIIQEINDLGSAPEKIVNPSLWGK